jgi:uncharacterized membrane protein YraQ (UPF0718 family)
MDAILIIGALVILMTVFALAQGGPSHALEGYRQGAELALSVLPQVALGFALAGLISVVIPPELIARWIGEGSGIQGLLIGTVAGVLTPGGPFLQFPLVASLARGGAGVGPLAAYLTAWSLIGLNRAIVWELPLLGGSFMVARYSISLAFPILIGLLMPVVVRTVGR